MFGRCNHPGWYHCILAAYNIVTLFSLYTVSSTQLPGTGLLMGAFGKRSLTSFLFHLNSVRWELSLNKLRHGGTATH